MLKSDYKLRVIVVTKRHKKCTHSCNNYTKYNSWILSQQSFFPFLISCNKGNMKMSHKMSLENGSREINPKRMEFSDTSPASVIINWRPVGHIQPAKASHLACRTLMYSEKRLTSTHQWKRSSPTRD